jgi:hypothetical protein
MFFSRLEDGLKKVLGSGVHIACLAQQVDKVPAEAVPIDPSHFNC